MPNVTRRQLEAILALDWLYSNDPNDRRSGRTYVLALVALRRLCNGYGDIGGWVEIEDHAQTRGPDRYLTGVIRDLAEQFGISVEVNRSRVRLVEAVPAAVRFAFEDLVVAHTPVDRPEDRDIQWVPDGLAAPDGWDALMDPPDDEGPPPKPPKPPRSPRATAWERLLEDDPLGMDGDEDE